MRKPKKSFEEIKRTNKNAKIKVTYIKKIQNQTTFTVYANVDGETYHRMLMLKNKFGVG